MISQCLGTLAKAQLADIVLTMRKHVETLAVIQATASVADIAMMMTPPLSVVERQHQEWMKLHAHL